MQTLVKFAPSKYQQAIFDFVTEGRGDAVVNAVAGSGKTSTLVEASKLLRSDRALFLAFNKHIATELESRLGRAMAAKTIHSIGVGCLRSYLPRVTVDESKIGDISKPYSIEISNHLEKAYQLQLKAWYRDPAGDPPQEPPNFGVAIGLFKKIVHFIRVTLTDVKDKAAVEAMCDRFGCIDEGGDLVPFDTLYTYLPTILSECERNAERGIIDYDDMLWLPYIWSLQPPKYEWIFVDECLPGDSLVTLADGSQLPIQTIVENRIPISVLCYNEQTSKIEVKAVTGWRKVPRRGRQIMQIGNLQATEDHPIYTKEFGYISMKSALTYGDVHVMVLNSEKVRSECAVNASGAVDYRRWATWRRINQQGGLEGETVQCQSKIYPRTSTATLPRVETVRATAMGRHFDINDTTTDRVWRDGLPFCNFNSSSIYRSLSVNQTEWWKETNNSSTSAIPYRFSSSSVVYGRWIDRVLGCTYSYLCATKSRFGSSCRLPDSNWFNLQEDGDNQGQYSNFHGSRDAIAREKNCAIYTPVFSVQDRANCTRNMRGLQQDFFSSQDFVAIANTSDLQQKLQCAARTQSAEVEQDEWVYCLDVADNHNFFADGALVHNCQDLSAAQLDLVLKLRAPGGRMLFVGDPKQAVYGFAGADSESFERIIERTSATVLPLSICYRCPATHIKLAQAIVAEIEAKEDATEGIVEDIKPNAVHEMIKEGDLIISRCTAPVVKLCIELIAKRIPARVRGRDIGKALTTIVRDVAKHPEFSFDKFGYYLEEYADIRLNKLKQKRNSEAQIESFSDRIQGIEVCYEAFNAKSLGDLQREIEALFSDSRSSVILSTVHRAKGLENERVFILEPDKLPLRWIGQQKWQLEQEFNVKYISLTRAKSALYFIR